MNLKTLCEIRWRLSLIPVGFLEDSFDRKFYGKPISTIDVEERHLEIFKIIKNNIDDQLVKIYSFTFLGNMLEVKQKVNEKMLTEQTKNILNEAEELLLKMEIDESVIKELDRLIFDYKELNQLKHRIATDTASNEDKIKLEEEFSFLLLKESLKDRFIKNDGSIMCIEDYIEEIKSHYKKQMNDHKNTCECSSCDSGCDVGESLNNEAYDSEFKQCSESDNNEINNK